MSGVASAGLVVVLFDFPPAKEYLAGSVGGGGFGLLCWRSVGRFVWKYYREELEGDDA